MGIVIRQSLRNVLYTYFGVVLGMVNKLILFNAWLTKEQFGLTELLITFMVLGSELSQLGVTRIVLRFFPYYHRDPEAEGQFVWFVSLYTLAGFLLATLLLWLGQPWIQSVYQENSPLFSGAYAYIFPIILAYTLQRFLTSLSQSLLKSVVPTFALHVGLRVAQMALILIYHFGWIGFTDFLNGYVVSEFIPGLLILGYLLWLRRLRFRTGLHRVRRRMMRIMTGYGLFSSLGEMTTILVNRVDLLMIGWLIGEATVATYAVAYYISTLIQMPARSINAIAVPILAKHLKNNELSEVASLYYKSAINNLILGGWVMIGIWVNLDNLFMLSPKHASGEGAAIFLGLASLINVATGLNHGIIVNSRHYRFQLYANLLLLGLVIGSNFLLIPLMQETGAAIATALSVLAYNALCCWYVWVKYRMQPFDGQTLKTAALIAAVLLIGLALPQMGHPLLDLVLRSALVTLLYVPAALALGLSADFNQAVLGLWKQAGGR
ncbi:MAG: lipopolysaccharide biosynthesis protein [Bacteroidia bacterium]|nr:lipopolysaccharide biosynthesis protein [Bacteroidia bacterium]